VSDVLRERIERGPESRYAISKATGIGQASLCRFVAGQRGLNLDNVDRLCEHFGLKLTATRRGGRGR